MLGGNQSLPKIFSHGLVRAPRVHRYRLHACVPERCVRGGVRALIVRGRVPGDVCVCAKCVCCVCVVCVAIEKWTESVENAK